MEVMGDGQDTVGYIPLLPPPTHYGVLPCLIRAEGGGTAQQPVELALQWSVLALWLRLWLRVNTAVAGAQQQLAPRGRDCLAWTAGVAPWHK